MSAPSILPKPILPVVTSKTVLDFAVGVRSDWENISETFKLDPQGFYYRDFDAPKRSPSESSDTERSPLSSPGNSSLSSLDDKYDSGSDGGFVENPLTFPNKIRVVVYPENVEPDGPPLSFMLHEKARSLIEAYHAWQKIKISPDELEAQINSLIQPVIDQTFGDGGKYDKKIAWEQAMLTVTANSLKELHQHYTAHLPKNTDAFKPYSFEKFSKEIIKKSGDMANQTDILILDLSGDQNKFSYNQGAQVTAHQQSENPRNFGGVVTGVVDEKGGRVHSAYFKHGSLAPLYDFKKRSWGQWIYSFFQTEQAILDATKKNVKEVLKQMAALRIAEGQVSGNGPHELHWNYQLLTTNLANDEHQAESYAYIVKAMDELDGTDLSVEVDGETYKFNVHPTVFNGAINRLANYEAAGFELNKYHTRTQANKKAYVHLTQCGLSDLFHDGQHPDEDLRLAYAKYKNLNDPQALKTSGFEPGSAEYMKARHQAIDKIESLERKRWEEASRSKLLVQSSTALRKKIKDPKTTPEELRKCWIELLKIYMDDLYYSGDYKKPEKAVAFNMYCSAYQQLIDMPSSLGCKSANDRTWIQRVLNDHLMDGISQNEGADALLHGKDGKPLHESSEAFHSFVGGIKSYKNSATWSCPQDTAGGTSKVGAKGYPFLSAIKSQLEPLAAFGHWAADKMKGKILGVIFKAVGETHTVKHQSKKP